MSKALQMTQLHGLRALESNYIWLLRQGHKAWVIDPGEASPVLDFLHRHELTLEGILVTHHHWDHTDGIDALVAEFAQIPVIGPANSPTSRLTHRVKEGETLRVLDRDFHVLETPGHTLDHVSYVTQEWAFVGDCLFGAGAGLFFEGTPAMARASFEKIQQLPPDTLLCSGHEYTLGNLKFARACLPDHPQIAARWHQAKQDNRAQSALSPTTLALENSTNPFLMFKDPEMLDALEQHFGQRPIDSNQAVEWIRRWKNQFDGLIP
jgi:hydroxyacylglutathione hydrolase